MRNMFLVISLLLTGCASWRIDPNFVSYVTSFENVAAKKKITTLRVGAEFDETLPDTKLAICEYSAKSNGINTIKVNPKQWRVMDPNCREAMIYHEMAHCALGLHEHDEAVILRKEKMHCGMNTPGKAFDAKNRKKEIERLFKSYERLINN